MTTLNEVFEGLRTLAEADTADAGTDKRRPSWGPALVLGDEILAALVNLNYPLPEKRVARLWATFAGPDKVTTYLRNDVSRLPMPAARVRAFELRLGTERSGERLLQAKRDRFGGWDVVANIRPRFPRFQELCRANEAHEKARRSVRQIRGMIDVHWITDERREQLRNELPNAEAALKKCSELALEIELARADYRRRKDSFGNLIKQRVAEFAGNPIAQMVAGAHVTGNCCICGRGLTDPISIERGIGPECFSHIAPGLRAYLDHQEGEAA